MAVKRINQKAHSYIIFGGTKGIGRLIADTLMKRDSCVTVASRTIDKTCYALHAVTADVRNERQVKSIFAKHKKHFGSAADVIINCAASQGPIGNSWEINAQRFRETIDINLTGSFIVAKTAVRELLKAGRGSIIMFSGGGAAYGRARFSPYASSKAGLIRLVETIADELAGAGYKGISINAIAPGAVSTGMTKEIIMAGKKAGIKALAEAHNVKKSGGTPCDMIIRLVDFLSDSKTNSGVCGRLIHVRENFELCKASVDGGKLRIVPFADKGAV